MNAWAGDGSLFPSILFIKNLKQERFQCWYFIGLMMDFIVDCGIIAYDSDKQTGYRFILADGFDRRGSMLATACWSQHYVYGFVGALWRKIFFIRFLSLFGVREKSYFFRHFGLCRSNCQCNSKSSTHKQKSVFAQTNGLQCHF